MRMQQNEQKKLARLQREIKEKQMIEVCVIQIISFPCLVNLKKLRLIYTWSLTWQWRYVILVLLLNNKFSLKKDFSIAILKFVCND